MFNVTSKKYRWTKFSIDKRITFERHVVSVNNNRLYFFEGVYNNAKFFRGKQL